MPSVCAIILKKARDVNRGVGAGAPAEPQTGETPLKFWYNTTHVKITTE